MKTLVVNAAKIRENPTDEWQSLAAMKGESAYEIAVRRGQFSGTEQEWLNAVATERAEAISSVESAGTTAVTNVLSAETAAVTTVNANRDSMLSAIEAKGDAALNSIQGKWDDALESIPADYTTLGQTVTDVQKSVTNLEMAFNVLPVSFDGKKETYYKIMKEWFIARGAVVADTARLTALCDEWYTLSRPTWDGWSSFYLPDVSMTSDGMKGGDNAWMVCEPSTDTLAEQDDYAGNPLFAVVDCNWIVDAETLEPMITAIDGISPDFARNDPTKFVGVLQMGGYVYTYETANEQVIGYTAQSDANHAGLEPVPESIRQDGTVRPWVVHGKYGAALVDGKYTNYAGIVQSGRQSSNHGREASKLPGAQYSCSTSADYSWLQLMWDIKYATLDSDRKMVGCVSYYKRYNPTAAATNTNVITLGSHAAEYYVGSVVMIGSSDNYDSGASYDISGFHGRMILAIDTEHGTITIDGDPVSVTTADYVNSWGWPNGATDAVLGNDGSPISNTNGIYPCKLQGIEYMTGRYEQIVNILLQYDTNGTNSWYEPYFVRLRSQQANSITENYEKTGHKAEYSASDGAGWKYIRKRTYRNGFFFADELSNGASSSNRYRDGIYTLAGSSAATIRSCPVFGALVYGVAGTGRSAVVGNGAVSYAYWYFGVRLSPNGSWGEFAS